MTDLKQRWLWTMVFKESLCPESLFLIALCPCVILTLSVRHQHPRELLWLAVHRDQHPNFKVPLRHTSASLVNYQSHFSLLYKSNLDYYSYTESLPLTPRSLSTWMTSVSLPNLVPALQDHVPPLSPACILCSFLLCEQRFWAGWFPSSLPALMFCV